MTDTMKKFNEYAEAHEEVLAAIETLGRETTKADAKAKIIALAAEAGIELTDADFAAEGEISDEEAAQAAGGGWANSGLSYSSGDYPVFSVGQRVYADELGSLYEGHVLSVSSTKDGGLINKEFTYSVRWEKKKFYMFGGTKWEDYNKDETGVYESQLSDSLERFNK